MPRSLISSLLSVLIPTFLAIYIVIRIGLNTFSWSQELPSGSAGSNVTGDQYAALLAGQEDASQKIQSLYKISATSGWILPSWTGDPLPLARELSKRAQDYVRAGNIAQAASHLKILLLWSQNLLNATGPGAARCQALDVSELAISALIACPGTLQYAALATLAESLSRTLATASHTRISNQLADLAESETGDAPRNLRIMANKNVLREDLRDTLDGHRANLTRLTIKSWLLICPRNPQLLKQSLQDLDSVRVRSQQLRQQLDALLDGTRPPLPE